MLQECPHRRRTFTWLPCALKRRKSSQASRHRNRRQKEGSAERKLIGSSATAKGARNCTVVDGAMTSETCRARDVLNAVYGVALCSAASSALQSATSLVTRLSFQPSKLPIV